MQNAAIENDDFEIRFSEGLIGLPECKRFRLLRHASEGLLLLDGLDNRLRLPLIDPREAFRDYRPTLRRTALGELADSRPEDLLLLAITVIQPNADAQVNLKAPLAIDVVRGCGAQIILDERQYSIAAPLAIVETA